MTLSVRSVGSIPLIVTSSFNMGLRVSAVLNLLGPTNSQFTSILRFDSFLWSTRSTWEGAGGRFENNTEMHIKEM